MSPRAVGHGVLRRLEALLVLTLGTGMGGFAASDRYAALMNPAFRWVTMAGACLIVAMGLALLVAPRRSPRWGAVLVFASLIPLVLLGRPLAEGAAVMMPPGGALPDASCSEEYAEFRVQSIFRTLSRETDDIEEGPVVVAGRIHRSAELDAQGHVILLEPLIACCLADAIAVGVRLTAPPDEPPPEDGTWVYICGTLRRLAQPVETPPFRVRAIMFTAISRTYLLEADRVVSFESLLEPVTGKIPAESCAAFAAALEETGVVEVLRGEGPFTVFAPLDASFARLLNAELPAGVSALHPARLRRLVEGFVVRGLYRRADLYDTSSLETLSGRVLSVEAVNGKLRVEGARILFGDQRGRNGMVHIVHPAWAMEER